MSSTILKIIPVKPDYIPNELSRDKVKKYLVSIFKKADIELIQTVHVEFIDQGQNFESVSCNYCDREIETDLWQEAMDKAYKTNFVDLRFTTPCCKKQTNLNDLKYNTPAGFAKFVISIPNAEKALSTIEIKELEALLNTRIRMIWAHY